MITKMFTFLIVVGLLVACNAAPTPTPPPAPTSSPTAGSQSSPTVTLGDNGGTLSLKVGNTFLLSLGDERDWDISLSDSSIVSRVPNITVIRGAQGVYTAKAVGKTTLSANGKVRCEQGQICPQNILAFRIDIIVE
jgi:hypothetical protein